MRYWLVLLGMLAVALGMGGWEVRARWDERALGAINPCTGEYFIFRDPPQWLTQVTPGTWSALPDEVRVNAVGLRASGTNGTAFLPAATGQVRLASAQGSVELGAVGELDLVGMGQSNRDFHLHGRVRLVVTQTGRITGATFQLRGSCT